MIIANLTNDDGRKVTYELADLKVPPFYLIRDGMLFAVQSWEGAGADTAVIYRRVSCLDVSCMQSSTHKQEHAA